MIPFFDEPDVPLLRILTGRGTDIAAARSGTGTSSTWPWGTSTTAAPRPNERFHKTILDEFYRVAFRKRIYGSLVKPPADLDAWMRGYDEARPHQGRWCYGNTPMQSFRDATGLAQEKVVPMVA